MYGRMQKEGSDTHQVAVDVECRLDIVGRYGIVDYWVSTSGEECAVYFSINGFLVVAHEVNEFIVMVTGDIKRTIVAFHKAGKAIKHLTAKP